MAGNADSRIDLFLDEREIEQCLYRYCRGIDRGDRDILKTVFHPDAIVDYGSFTGNAVETMMSDTALTPDTKMQHVVTNILIEMSGERALCESTYLAWIGRKDASGEVDDWVLGRYLDQFEKRNGVWAIARRDVVRTWGETRPKNKRPWDEWPTSYQAKFVRRDKSDALYAALRALRSD